MAETRTEETATERGPDPRVLVFACNWCSYAGADTAGVSRLPQTPHFRLLRVMCSGRVHPSFVLRAFARGADGVMVSGCHFGDCHYRFGNYRAVEQYEKTEALIHMLGLEPARLRLEWISAAEGIRFAEIINEFVEQVRAVGPSPLAPDPTEVPASPAAQPVALAPTRVLACLECGRCTAVCPVAPYQTFSPRRLVSRLVAAGLDRLAAEPSLWTCLTCGRCSAVCPAGVDYSGFMLAARAAAAAAGLRPAATEPAPDPAGGAADAQEARAGASRPAARPDAAVAPCSHGGVFEQISLMHTRPALRQRRMGWLTEELQAVVLAEGERGEGHDLLFVGCSPYFAAYFGGETGAGLAGMLRSAVRLLNRAGMAPGILANERCCGHHLRVAGRVGEAETLARLVAAQLRATGAKRVIALCPECLVSLRGLVARHAPGLQVVHLSEVLAEQGEALAARRPAGATGPGRITYQDPCRLGRASGLYDPPRALLTDIAGGQLVEMEHHGPRSICCGNAAWLNCNAGTQQLQAARLAEAAATGSRRLVTACPACYIHLRCAREAVAQSGPEPVAIADIWSLLDESLIEEGATGAHAGAGGPEDTEARG